MPKGKNSTENPPSRKVANSKRSRETVTSKDVRQCKFCQSKLDRTKTGTLKCWLCGKEDFAVVKTSQRATTPAHRSSRTQARQEESAVNNPGVATEPDREDAPGQVETSSSFDGGTSESRPTRRLIPKYLRPLVLTAIAVVVGIIVVASVPPTQELPLSDDVKITLPRPPLTESIDFIAPAGMVLIPGGTFKMGRDDGDQFESPSHLVQVKAFLMDRYEVTRLEYKTCVDLGKCRPPYGWNGSSYPENTGRWPVTGVNWDDAVKFAATVGKRLPSEEEWEFAAGRGKGSKYPWGDRWSNQVANVDSNSLTEVGSYSGYFGLFDMVGNAQEWTTGEWKQYPLKHEYLKTDIPAEGLRLIRGGNFANQSDRATVTFRNALRVREAASEEKHYERTGFRCVRSIQDR